MIASSSEHRYVTARGGMFTPAGSRVLLRRIEYESISRGGIVLPETAREKPYQGIVLAIGPGERDWRTGELVPITAAIPGDTVLWLKYAGHEFTLDDEGLVVIPEKDILGVITESAS